LVLSLRKASASSRNPPGAAGDTRSSANGEHTLEIIQLRDYGRRTRVDAQQVHDQIAKALKASSRVRLDFADVESIGATFLDRTLGALVGAARSDGSSVDCVRALLPKCGGEHRQGVTPSGAAPRAS